MKNKALFTKAAQEFLVKFIDEHSNSIVSNSGIKFDLTARACELIKESFGGDAPKPTPFTEGGEVKSIYVNPDITKEDIKNFFQSLTYTVEPGFTAGTCVIFNVGVRDYEEEGNFWVKAFRYEQEDGNYSYGLAFMLTGESYLWSYDEVTDTNQVFYDFGVELTLMLDYMRIQGEATLGIPVEFIAKDIAYPELWNGTLLSNTAFRAPLGNLKKIEASIQTIVNMISEKSFEEVTYKELYFNTQEFDTWDKIWDCISCHTEGNQSIIQYMFLIGSGEDAFLEISIRDRKITLELRLDSGDIELTLFDDNGWNTELIVDDKLDLNAYLPDKGLAFIGSEITYIYSEGILMMLMEKGEEITLERIKDLNDKIAAIANDVNGNIVYIK